MLSISATPTQNTIFLLSGMPKFQRIKFDPRLLCDVYKLMSQTKGYLPFVPVHSYTVIVRQQERIVQLHTFVNTFFTILRDHENTRAPFPATWSEIQNIITLRPITLIVFKHLLSRVSHYILDMRQPDHHHIEAILRFTTCSTVTTPQVTIIMAPRQVGKTAAITSFCTATILSMQHGSYNRGQGIYTSQFNITLTSKDIGAAKDIFKLIARKLSHTTPMEWTKQQESLTDMPMLISGTNSVNVQMFLKGFSAGHDRGHPYNLKIMDEVFKATSKEEGENTYVKYLEVTAPTHKPENHVIGTCSAVKKNHALLNYFISMGINASIITLAYACKKCIQAGKPVACRHRIWAL